MSEVRMCDTCGNVFSLLEDDWAFSQTQIRKRGTDGRLRHEDAELHTCGRCVGGITKGTDIHRAALEAAKKPESETPPRYYDPDYTKRLEKELGLDGD